MSLAEKMIEYRAKENITQKELAERCGLSHSVVHLIESGKKVSPSKITKAKIELVIGKEE